MSGYDDLIKRGVRLKNQKSALLRGIGLTKKEVLPATQTAELFVTEGIEDAIDKYESERKRYETEFNAQIKAQTLLRLLKQIPGIGVVGAVKIGAAIVNGDRFPNDSHFHSYCGLVRHDRISGGRSYGSKKPRYRRDLKTVFKTAALSAVSSNNVFTDYYNHLINERRYPDHQARHAVARKIATAAYAVMKHKKKFNPGGLGALRMLKKRS